ncbi:Crp/Fnr family transcriptional regulator [Desulfuribacillus alkaliarsenatis]|uniref:Crp/Fnr family transcriptional regulator n=1 Tax=Desulfuribacillus alkaliarsenatis TaxID=766136 RepID=UPI00159F0A51|nr:Crp/Fnr family transcriptional regulator [Desulfuribacillus alkaliarsenatis]
MLEQLREIPIFYKLSDQTLEEIANNITIKDYRADELVYSEGEPSNHIYIVVSGRVKITKVSSTGREKILHIIRENEMFGEQALFENGVNPHSAKTIEKALLFQIRLNTFKKIIDEDHECATMLLEVMNLKLRQAYRQIINLSFKDTYSRLASRLFKLARDHGIEEEKGLLIKAKLTQQELADYVGTSRETISRILSDMVQKEILIVDRHRIYIKDYQALKEVALGSI